MSSCIEIAMPLSYNKITHFNLQTEYTRMLIKKLQKRSKLRQTRKSDVCNEKTITSCGIEIEMPLNYNKITQYNLQIDYTKKLLNKLQKR